MRNPACSCLIVSLALLTGQAGLPAESRMWTSSDGKHMQAELVDVRNGEAVLKLPGAASTVRVPFTRLSPGDQEFLKSWVKPGAIPATPVKPAAGKPAALPTDGEEIQLDAQGFPIGGNSTVKRDENGWPEVVALKEKPAFTVVSEDKKANTFTYRSDHFEFFSTQRLSGEIVREFSRLFETTFEAVVAMPLRINPSPPDGFFKVVLYETKEAYFTAGGIPGSAGMYTSRTKEIMVPLPFLGVKQIGERWVLDDRDGNHTLVHEVVHQVMHDWLGSLPTWVTEGIAEYITAGRYASGRLTLRGHGKNMEDYKSSGARETRTLALADLMDMDGETWAKALETGGAGRNYRTSMLLFYFFCHEDGDKTGKVMIDYFNARRKKRDNDRNDRESLLIRGRDAITLQKEFKRGLASVGIRVEEG